MLRNLADSAMEKVGIARYTCSIAELYGSAHSPVQVQPEPDGLAVRSDLAIQLARWLV